MENNKIKIFCKFVKLAIEKKKRTRYNNNTKL